MRVDLLLDKLVEPKVDSNRRHGPNQCDAQALVKLGDSPPSQQLATGLDQGHPGGVVVDRKGNRRALYVPMCLMCAVNSYTSWVFAERTTLQVTAWILEGSICNDSLNAGNTVLGS